MKPTIYCLCLAVVLLGGCGSDNADKRATAKKDHPWKAQEQALKKAKEVEKLVKEAEQARRKKIEDSFQ